METETIPTIAPHIIILIVVVLPILISAGLPNPDSHEKHDKKEKK